MERPKKARTISSNMLERFLVTKLGGKQEESGGSPLPGSVDTE